MVFEGNNVRSTGSLLRKSVFAIAAADNSQSFSATLLLLIAAVAMVSIHIYQLLNFSLTSGEFRIYIWRLQSLSASWRCLKGLALKRRPAVASLWALAILAVLWRFIFTLSTRALTEVRSFAPSSSDLTVAVLLLATTFILSGFQWGWTYQRLAVIGLAYGYWGEYMPGDIFFHAGIAPTRLIGYTSIPYFQGLLGGLTSLSATHNIFVHDVWWRAESNWRHLILLFGSGSPLVAARRLALRSWLLFPVD